MRDAVRSGWHEVGWATVSSVLASEELAQLREECERVAAQPLDGEGDLRHRVVSSPLRPDRLDPVIDLSPMFAALAADPRICSLASAALDREVELLKDKLVLKPPGAAGYALHQDHAYLPAGAPRAHEICVVVLALADVTIEAGPIELVPARHDALHTPDGVPADLDVRSLGGVAPVPVLLAAGDALVMHHLAPHRSGPNQSEAWRPMLFFTYVARSDGRRREWYYEAAARQRGSGTP